MAAERDAERPAEQAARLYEQAEAEAARATERLVGSGGFASLLGQLAENAAALTRLSNDAFDLVLRNLRLAGRRDVIRLSRQLARTEDKLERLLQEIEAVQDRLGAEPPVSGNGAGSGARRTAERHAPEDG
jgi:hypothetical protein